MAKRSVRNGSETIDPLFFVPDGVDELHYADDEFQAFEFEGGQTDADLEVIDDSGGGDVVDDTDYDDTPETTYIVDIFSQTIRTSPDGSEVVDVVFDVADVNGADNYELRVTKI